MIRAMRTAASGMLAQQMRVDSIANNISNANTSAFKKDHLSFRSLLYRQFREPGAGAGAGISNPTGLQVGSGVEVGSSMKVHSQGDLQQTGNAFDLGINGEGFFRIGLGNGEFRYTRDGSLRRSVEGDLVTTDGFFLEPRINVPNGVTGISIGLDGTVNGMTENNTPATFGQILLYGFANPAGLKAIGSNLFQETGSSGAAVQGQPGAEGNGLIVQGSLERSNVQVVEELIELIQAQRNYEVNSRTIRVGDEMLQQVSNLLQ
jgi:flagellar basal-body rod protein FlgG